MTVLKIQSNKLVRNITLDVVVTGHRPSQIRMTVGARIMRFGAWIIGCQIIITDKTE